MVQVNGLHVVVKRQDCLDKEKHIQIELRQAMIFGKYNDIDTLMVLLEHTQIELEAMYLP